MADFAQDVFDRAEDIAEVLNYIAGCEDALYLIISDRLPRDAEGPAYALIEASKRFRIAAQEQARQLAMQAARN